VRGGDDRGATVRTAREVDAMNNPVDELIDATAESYQRGTTGTVVMAYLPIVVAAALIALVPLRYHDSRAMMGVVIGGVVYACYAVAFNIIFGSTGQLFLCTGALAGIGGYASAILSDRAGVPMVLSMAIALVISSVVAATLSWVSVRRQLDTIFIGIVTIAFALSYQNMVLGLREWTNGETGLRVEAGSESWISGQVAPYYLFLALLVVYLVVFRALQRSRVGWAFRSLRDDGLAAELSGVDVAKYRVMAGAIGGAMLGLAGALYAHTELFIGPTTFDFGHVDVSVLVMLAFGGIGSLLGPVVGAAAFTWLDEFLDAIDIAQLRLMIYGGVIIALFLGFRRGVVPAVTDLFKRIRKR
jgi:branched-chain amino acid transport system permease protein